MSYVEPIAPQRRWTPMSAPLALLAGFAVAVVGGLVVAVVAAIAGANVNHEPPAVDIVSTVIQDAALVASAVFFAARLARPRPEQFGLVRTRVLPAVAWLLLGYGAFLLFSAAWQAGLDLHQKEQLVDQLGANDSTFALIVVAALTCVIAPACEEFFFRGYFFTALRNWRGIWPAALITGIVFGAIHAGSAPVSYLVPLAFFGFCLCLLYVRTRSLYPSIGLHVLNNSIAFGITEGWSWQVPVLAVSALATTAVALVWVARATTAQ